MTTAQEALESLRDHLQKTLQEHRAESTVDHRVKPDAFGTPEYKNPRRWGYDRGLVIVLHEINRRLAAVSGDEADFENDDEVSQDYEPDRG